MKGYGFYIDSSACSGCKTCQVACKDKNNLPVGVLFRRVYEICGADWRVNDEGAWIPDVVAYHLSISCNHCENPLCVAACPTRALQSGADGIVTIDPQRCIGCRYCEWACPYGAPQFNLKTGIMLKCDFCVDYLREGKPPVCVSACPMRALDFGRMDELLARYGTERGVFPLPDQTLTQPSLVITPHPGTAAAEPLGAAIVNREEVKHER